MSSIANYPVTPAVTFPTHPEWPVYEAPARWYIQKIKNIGSGDAA